MSLHFTHLRFELQRLGPWLIVFLLSVVGCVWSSPGWHFSTELRSSGPVWFVLILSVLFVVGWIFRGMGPRRPLDLWAGRPGSSVRWDAKLTIVFGFLLLPMIVGHGLVIERLGFSPWITGTAVIRGFVGLVLFLAWAVAVSLLTRSWREFMVVFFLTYLPLAQLIFFLLGHPAGFWVIQLVSSVGLGSLLILSLRQGARWRAAMAVLLLAVVIFSWIPVPSEETSYLSADTLGSPSTTPMWIELTPVDAGLGIRDPFLCAGLDDGALEPGYAYELEVTAVSFGDRVMDVGLHPKIGIWQKPARSDEHTFLPTVARLNLSDRLSEPTLTEMAAADGLLEVRGTLRRLSVLSPSAMPLSVGAFGKSGNGAVRLAGVETYNRSLELTLREAWLLPGGPLVRPSADHLMGFAELPADRIWVGPDRRWAAPLGRRSGIGQGQTVSLLAPFSGMALGLEKLRYQSPYRTVSRDLPGSELVLWPRLVEAETELTLWSPRGVGLESFLCRGPG